MVGPQTFKFEDHSVDGTFYQDSLFRVYILNASFALRVMWNVARMFMHPVTAQKVQIYGNAGPDVIKTLVDQGIPLTAIPSYLHKDARGANPIGMIGNSTRKQVLNVYGKKETETLTVRVPKNQDVSWSVRVQGRSSEGARVHVRLISVTTKNKVKRTVCKFNVVSKCPNCSHWRAPENCDVRMILSHDLKMVSVILPLWSCMSLMFLRRHDDYLQRIARVVRMATVVRIATVRVQKDWEGRSGRFQN